MIKRLSHTTVFVNDQDDAKAFYTEKLGFEVRNDVTMDGFRWLTVSPAGQDTEMILMPLSASPMMDAETVETMRGLLAKGALGAGVFQTDDCEKAYRTLSERGVTFVSPPTRRPYGIEAMMKDNSGNWFSLTEPKPMG